MNRPLVALSLGVLQIVALASRASAIDYCDTYPLPLPVDSYDVFWSMDDGTIRAADTTAFDPSATCGILWKNADAPPDQEVPILSIAIDRRNTASTQPVSYSPILYYAQANQIRYKPVRSTEDEPGTLLTSAVSNPSLVLSDYDLNEPFLKWHDNLPCASTSLPGCIKEGPPSGVHVDYKNVGTSAATMRIARVVGGLYWWSVDEGAGSSVYNALDNPPQPSPPVKIFDEPVLITALGMGPEFDGGPGSAALYWASATGEIYAASANINTCIYESDGMGGFKRVPAIFTLAAGGRATAMWGHGNDLYYYDDIGHAIGKATIEGPNLSHPCYEVMNRNDTWLQLDDGDQVRGIAFGTF